MQKMPLETIPTHFTHSIIRSLTIFRKRIRTFSSGELLLMDHVKLQLLRQSPSGELLMVAIEGLPETIETRFSQTCYKQNKLLDQKFCHIKKRVTLVSNTLLSKFTSKMVKSIPYLIKQKQSKIIKFLRSTSASALYL